VTSEWGKGTTVKVRLPVAHTKDAQGETETPGSGRDTEGGAQ